MTLFAERGLKVIIGAPNPVPEIFVQNCLAVSLVPGANGCAP